MTVDSAEVGLTTLASEPEERYLLKLLQKSLIDECIDEWLWNQPRYR